MKSTLLMVLSLTTVGLGLTLPSLGQGTPIGGTIVNQTWIKTKSPYLVTNDVFVAGLTIREGVQVIVQGNYVFEVGGRLRVLGTTEEPVEFSPQDEQVGWQGLLFRDAVPGSSLNHAVIQGSKNSALRITNTPPALTNCLILNNTSPFHGGGILASVSASSPLILQSCVVSNNVAGIDNPMRVYGGGVCVFGDALLMGCSITHNRTQGTEGYGGGVFVIGNCTIKNTKVLGNIAAGTSLQFGGGIYFDADTVTGLGHLDVANCLVSENGVPPRNFYGGGLMANSGTTRIRNSIFSRNIEGIRQEAGSLDLLNCVVIGSQGYGIVESSAASIATITNCIVFANNGTDPQIFSASGGVETGYSCIQGGYPGEGNISFGPSLCPVTFSLLEGSPCIDAGHPGREYRDGCVSIANCSEFARGTSRNDMGAFGGPWVCDWTDPSSKPKIRIEPITDVVLDGEPAAMDVLATGDKVLSYQWYRSEDEALTLHPILGATNAVLSWSAAQVSDDSFIARTTNLFYVEVSNEAGRVISSPASLIVTPLEVSATFKAGKVELTIRRNKPIAKCEIHTAKDLKDFVPSPATVVATVDLTESLTTWRDPIPPRSTNQFYRALPVQ